MRLIVLVLSVFSVHAVNASAAGDAHSQWYAWRIARVDTLRSWVEEAWLTQSERYTGVVPDMGIDWKKCRSGIQHQLERTFSVSELRYLLERTKKRESPEPAGFNARFQSVLVKGCSEGMRELLEGNGYSPNTALFFTTARPRHSSYQGGFHTGFSEEAEYADLGSAGSFSSTVGSDIEEFTLPARRPVASPIGSTSNPYFTRQAPFIAPAAPTGFPYYDLPSSFVGQPTLAGPGYHPAGGY